VLGCQDELLTINKINLYKQYYLYMKYSDILAQAIAASHIIPKGQKPVLDAICMRSHPVPAKELEDALQLSRASINFSLQMLLKRNFILRSKDGVFLYTPNTERLLELQARYKEFK